MEDLGHWSLKPGLSWDNTAFGFIYLITNLSNQKKYIGCKMLSKTTKLKPLKGKKQKRKVTKDSDWRTYCSSSKELQKEINELGESSFKFEILKFANSKSSLKFFELLYQIMNNVIFDSNYMNGIINVRLGKISECEAIKDFNEFKLD